MEKPSPLGEKIQYGIIVTGETVSYGSVGYVIKLLYGIQDTLSANVPKQAFEVVATLEEKVANPLIENTGRIGKWMYEAEKWRGKFWSRILGQTEEKQAKRREDYLKEKYENSGAQEQSYPPNQNTQAIVSQPSQPQVYHQDHDYMNAGNFIVAASIVIGAMIGQFKASKERRKAKQNK